MKTTKAIINPIIVPMSSSMETSIPDPEQNDTHYEEFQGIPPMPTETLQITFWDEFYGPIYTCPFCTETELQDNFNFCPICGKSLKGYNYQKPED